MDNLKLRNAYSEVLHYLKGIKRSDIDKIPHKLMDFLEENKNQNYICNFDYTKPLSELKLSEEANGLIGAICLNYWCNTENEKRALKNVLTANEESYHKLLLKKYNPENIFKKEGIEKESYDSKENTQMIAVEDNKGILMAFRKIRNKIKKWLHIS